MSSTGVATPRRASRFLRVWLFGIIIALAALAITLLWAWPAPDWERVNRVVGTGFAVLIALLLLLLWFLFFSGVRWWLRLGAPLLLLVLLGGGAWTAVERIEFTGDMVPIVHWRWEPAQEEVVAAHRRQQANGVAPVAVELSRKDTDFPEYRGRQRDGKVNGPPLSRDWRVQPSRLLWRQPVGGGYAGIVVAGNAAVTIEQRGKQEAVVCYDTASGGERWVHAYLAVFDETLGGKGPRATPTIADGDVYSLGATGSLCCLELGTGRVRWSLDILADNDNIQWGMSGSPLVFDNVVVVNPGVQRSSAVGGALVALDRTSGKLVWRAGNTRAGYSSPMLATLAGRRQILLFDGEGIGGYDATEGRELWRHPWITQQGINVAQPVVLAGDRVLISSGYGVGSALLKITESSGQWSVQPLWQKKTLRCRFTSPVEREGFIYGLDEGILVCLDAENGDRKWHEGRYGHGQLLLAGDLLVILSEAGKLALVEATPVGYHEQGHVDALEGKTWNCFALADGKVYVRNSQEMACYDLAGSR